MSRGTTGAARPVADMTLLAGLWLVWGLSWPAMRIVFLEMPVWQFRAATSLVGGAILLGAGIASRGGWRVPRRQWGTLAAASLFNIAVWNITVGYGLYYLGAGHTVILVYTLPIWTAMLSVAVLSEPMGLRTVAAVILGAGGVAALLSVDFAALGTSPLGAIFALIAAAAWAVGTIIVKRQAWTVNMYALAGWQLLLAAPPIAVIAVATESFTMHQASAAALWSSLYVVLVAIVGGYALWFSIVERFPATVAAVGTLVTPVVGVASGALVLGEPVGWREAAALVLVLGAVALVVFRPGAPRQRTKGG